MKFLGEIEIQFRFRQYLGPRFQAAGVTLQFSTNDEYSFTSKATWPDSNINYSGAVEKGVKIGLKESGYDINQGVHIVLKDIDYHEVDSSEFAFFLAAKCAVKSRDNIRHDFTEQVA
jgi:hypothetical protein